MTKRSFPSLWTNGSWYIMMYLAVVRYWSSYRFILTTKAPPEHVLFLKVGICFWALFVLWVWFSLRQESKKGKVGLKTGGPFRFVAHPAYFSYILADLIFLTYDHSSPILIVTAGAYYFFITRTAYLEECKMIGRSGEEAKNYYGGVVSIHRVLGKI